MYDIGFDKSNPYEIPEKLVKPMDKEKIRKGIRLILEGIGDDPDRPGLSETPDRFARMCEEIFAGMKTDPASVIKILPGEEHDAIILLRDIPFYSMCEHHFIPFLGHCHVAYVPKSGICGISKLARTVEVFARRLQVQERLTTQIADALMEALDPKGVMVVISAEHLCMTMRGVRKPGTKTVTSCLRGVFMKDPKTRAEAMALIHDRKE
jgi:GTP cyclohydrolase I